MLFNLLALPCWLGNAVTTATANDKFCFIPAWWPKAYTLLDILYLYHNLWLRNFILFF